MRDVDLDRCSRVPVVDEGVADTDALWLDRRGFGVETARRGGEALERLDPDVDGVLHDRRMSNLPDDVVGRAVRTDRERLPLEELRACRRCESAGLASRESGRSTPDDTASPPATRPDGRGPGIRTVA